ncbi:MAG: ATP-binding protein [Prevotella sp.]
MKKILLAALISVSLSLPALAENVRVISTRNGLSSQSVLSMCQDSNGFVWAGTCTGLDLLNMYDCLSIGNYFTSLKTTGAMIDGLEVGEPSTLWIHTNLGLQKFSQLDGKVEIFPEISGTYRVAANANGYAVVLRDNGAFYYYNKQQRIFERLTLNHVKYDDILTFYLTPDNEIFIVSKTRPIAGRLVEQEEGKIAFERMESFTRFSRPLKNAWYDGTNLYVLDNVDNLSMSHEINQIPTFQYNVSELIKSRGNISCVIHDGKDLVIGFVQDGAVRLKATPMDSRQYEIEDLPIQGGIIELLKDQRQDILWVATDGKGILAISNDAYSYHNELFSKLDIKLSAPVRALYRDADETLWVGTKGNGIISYPRFSFSGGGSPSHVYSVNNSALSDNSVYCFTPSRRPILWIGSDGKSLNYYSYDSHTIKELSLGISNFGNVHDILELSKNELWITTGGYGVFRVLLGGPDNAPVVTDVKQILYDRLNPGNSQFTNIVSDNRFLWFACRNGGLFRYERKTGHIVRFSFGARENNLRNDIMSVSLLPNGKIFCATSSGLITMKRSNGKYVWKTLDLNSRVHNVVFRSIVAHAPGTIWAASSSGLLHYDDSTQSIVRLTAESGIDILEFSDGAAFYDNREHVAYFGGTNGFVAVAKSANKAVVDYHPDICFQMLKMGDAVSAISLREDCMVELPHDQNNFVMYYNAPDYINGNSYFFQYRFNDDKKWIDNADRRQLNFSNLQPGTYRLQMRYIHGGYTSKVYSMAIRILPPWYLSWWMKTVYWLCFLIAVWYLVRMYIMKQRRRRDRLIKDMDQQRKDDVYESKLRFFTNITHEFATPISLISGPCQRILDMPGLSSQIKKYADLIAKNSVRLNDLIQEIMEFRRIETDHRIASIEKVRVSEVLESLVDEFSLVAEQAKVDFQTDIQKGVEWNTDHHAFITIATNLLSNAFRYVPDGGYVRLKLHTSDDQLILTFVNNGQAVSQDQIERMFDRYKILERLETNRDRGKGRNGLGLAISRGLVKLLDGDIHVEGGKGETLFTVTLPQKEVTQKKALIQNVNYINDKPNFDKKVVTVENKHINIVPDKPVIIYIDANDEMLWFIRDCFEGEFNVVEFHDAQKAMEGILEYNPDVIIADIMIEPMNGIEFCRQIKQNAVTAHIPVVLISSLNDDQTRIDSMEAEADMYITRPFDVDYLRSVVNKFLKHNTVLKNYYQSSLSSFERVNSKFIHKEDKELYDNMKQIIEDNITNPSLSTQFVANELGLGIRNLYRRLQSITEKKPSAFIKEARLERARVLLTTTRMSMEEVCYKSGFVNRGTFYKLFSTKFGCTPKQYHDKMMSETKELLSGGDKE